MNLLPPFDPEPYLLSCDWPQAGILAVGGPQQRVALSDEGVLSSSTYMAVTLTADHRVIDGEMAAELLAKFAENMAAPVRLML